MQKTAYFYSIMTKPRLKPHRAVALPQINISDHLDNQDGKIAVVALRYKDQDEESPIRQRS